MESFLINVRLLVEFLGVQPSSKKADASAASLDPAWQPPKDTELALRLKEHWRFASKHVVHFSDQSHLWQTLNRRRLDSIADDVLTLWDDYATLAAHPMIQRRGNFTVFGDLDASEGT